MNELTRTQQWYTQFSNDEKKARQKKLYAEHMARLTPEEKKALQEKKNAQRRARYQAKSEEDRKAFNKKQYDRVKNWYVDNQSRRQFTEKAKYWSDEGYREARKEAKKQRRDRSKEYIREIRREYELSKEDYDSLVSHQSNKCAICNTEMTKPHVDHCHKSGLVRGLLCQGCNNGIGCLRDRVDILQNAIRYLRRSNKELPQRLEDLPLPDHFVKLYYRTRKRGTSYDRTCPCGAEFIARRNDAMYCTKHCKARVK